MDILVSINCITYNHEKYISAALESFLSQKTNFQYEIIVGDDCSTDGTRKILDKYKSKFSDKIRLVTSDKNVGMMENSIRVHNASRGKYIAVCEGDDYWIDPYKLQKQVDYMIKNTNCTICFHNAYKEDVNTSRRTLFFDKEIKSRKYGVRDMIGLFTPTASRMYLKSTLDNPPNWYKTSIVGDLPSQLIQTNYGYAYYMEDVMSVYRVSTETSATTALFGNQINIEKVIKNNESVMDMLENFNKDTDYKYNKEIQERKNKQLFKSCLLTNDLKTLKKLKDYKQLSKKEKIKRHLRYFFPRLYNVYRR